MDVINLLHLSSRSELRQWLAENHEKEKCCWVLTYRSKCPEWEAIPYIDVVEEALCFGWIDSTLKRLPDGRLVQRLSPRRPKSHWTQLNVDRCMALEDRGLMTDAGRRAMERGIRGMGLSPSEIGSRTKKQRGKRLTDRRIKFRSSNHTVATPKI